MRSKIRYLLALTAIFAVLILCCLFTNTPEDKIIKFEGGVAKIHFDLNSGIPHISGTSENAVYFGLGYAHATERLFDLALKRAIARGVSAEIFGEEAVSIDKAIRSFQFQRVVDEEYRSLPENHKDILRAYASGINFYVKNLPRFPLEFYLLGLGFDKWTELDTIYVFKLLNLVMSSHWQITTLRTGIAKKYGTDFAEKIIPSTPEFMFPETILPEMGHSFKDVFSGLYTHLPKKVNNSEHLLNGGKFSSFVQKGSNAWAVHGNFTKSGFPLLGSDPHLCHDIPSEIFLAGLDFPDGRKALGATMPGIPALLMGRNGRIAWGITISLIENVDLYDIVLNENRTSYFYNNTWVNLDVHEEVIKVKGKNDTLHYFYRTHHGPILAFPMPEEAAVLFGIGNAVFMETPVSIAWAGLMPGDHSLEAALNLQHAQNLQEFQRDVQKLEGLVLSVVFATNDGDIGYWATGKIPARKSIKQSLFVRDGSNPENDWYGFLPPSENPHVINPSQGFVASCNNRINPGNQFFDSGTTVPTNSRGHRASKMISEEIAAGRALTLDFMKKMQNDVTDEVARNIVPNLIKILDTANCSHPLIDKYLRKWDFVMEENSTSALVYSLWKKNLENSLLHKLFPNKFERESILSSFYIDEFIGRLIVLWANNQELDSEICENSNNILSSQKCVVNVMHSIEETEKNIRTMLGRDPKNWKYGYLNVNNPSHLPFGMTFLKPLFDIIEPYPGSSATLFYHIKNYINTEVSTPIGPVFRLVTDLESPDTTETIGDMGESSNIFSVHYGDFLQMLKKGKYVSFKQLFELHK